MALINYSYSSFPALTSTEGWPTSESFFYPTTSEKPFITNPFIWPDTCLSMDAIQSLDAMSMEGPVTGPQLESKSSPPSVEPPFSQVELFPFSFSCDAIQLPSSPAFDFNLSPSSDESSGDGPQDSATGTLASPVSPRSQPTSEHSPVPPSQQKPKRGRPRLDRSTFPLNQHSKRLPHNQVERKYRDGIKASLERLRKLVPTLCQEDKPSGLMDRPKHSKVTILEAAIRRIKEIEKERDMYRAESKHLRRTWASAGGHKV
ncbi:hypothetical protein SLS60_002526 [Paraconiothyrium brasiliense]|uniref:BHLH domain-containing protein n=1 Tax=Paraconiothyrium brasiliense TaxID=300254 RepID=A0ABR3S2D7_9PLEO